MRPFDQLSYLRYQTHAIPTFSQVWFRGHRHIQSPALKGDKITFG